MWSGIRHNRFTDVCNRTKVLPAGWNGNTMYNESGNIEIIRNTRDSIKRSFDLVQSAREEVLRLFSSIPAFCRQM